jgi:spermidine/putrescine transport system substrate-binding protein
MPERARNVNRREFLGRAGLVTGAMAFMPSLLAACGGDDDDGTDSASESDTGGGGDPNRLVVSNWPLYIDPTEGGTRGSVDLFREETGVNLRYTEDYNDNNEFFAKIQPDLQAGRRLTQDVIVPTYWLAARLIGLEWVDPLPLDEMTNYPRNLVPDLREPSWDPDGIYTVPWQSGITGIAYNIEAAGRELRTMDDLFDPEFRGRVGFLTEMRDTMGLLLLNTGKDPAEATFDDAQEAFDKLERAQNDGQIRSFTGNDYQDDLVAGNFVACVGWSGDVAQLALDEPNLRFSVPEEGGMRWSDVMVLPKGARNRTAAAKWVDYVYDPVNAARIAAYVGFISPVEGVQQQLARSDDPAVAALAESELMFPSEEMMSNLHVFADLDEDEEAQFDARFAEIRQG